jgi:hypothetical protein
MVADELHDTRAGKAVPQTVVADGGEDGEAGARLVALTARIEALTARLEKKSSAA